MTRYGLEWLYCSLPGFFLEGDEGGSGGGSGSGAGDGGSGSGDGSGAGGKDEKDGKDGEEKFDAAYVRQLRGEAAKHRKEAADLAAKLKKIDDEKLSEADRLKKQTDEANAKATEAEKRAREAIGEARVTTAANRAQAIDADAVYALVKGKLEFDDDGKPTNVDALITQLKKDRPHLFQARGGSADGGAGGKAATGGMNDFIRRSAGR